MPLCCLVFPVLLLIFIMMIIIIIIIFIINIIQNYTEIKIYINTSIYKMKIEVLCVFITANQQCYITVGLIKMNALHI